MCSIQGYPLACVPSGVALAVLPSAYELTGLSRGGQQVQRCKEVFGKAIKLLVELASLQVREGVGGGVGGEVPSGSLCL